MMAPQSSFPPGAAPLPISIPAVGKRPAPAPIRPPAESFDTHPVIPPPASSALRPATAPFPWGALLMVVLVVLLGTLALMEFSSAIGLTPPG
jgi:hypothetical protein